VLGVWGGPKTQAFTGVCRHGVFGPGKLGSMPLTLKRLGYVCHCHSVKVSDLECDFLSISMPCFSAGVLTPCLVSISIKHHSPNESRLGSLIKTTLSMFTCPAHRLWPSVKRLLGLWLSTESVGDSILLV
jgi:hypothetical protein